MRIEFRRLDGAIIGGMPWTGSVASDKELKSQAKSILSRFYEGDERQFWPKRQFGANPPQVVSVLSSDGALLASYSIRDLSEETARTLADAPEP
jgi:hypothetical protein